MKLTGYAAVFNSLSTDLGDFRETIKPGAFRRSLASGQPVFGLHYHAWSDVLGSTRSGTLKVWEDSKGLAFELLLPESPLGENIHASVARGDIQSMSFAFAVSSAAGESWRETSRGIERTLLDVRLHEVSTVARPAYEATSVAARAVSEQASRNLAARQRMQARLNRSMRLVGGTEVHAA